MRDSARNRGPSVRLATQECGNVEVLLTGALRRLLRVDLKTARAVAATPAVMELIGAVFSAAVLAFAAVFGVAMLVHKVAGLFDGGGPTKPRGNEGRKNVRVIRSE